MAIDQAKLEALLGRAVVDIGANFHAALVVTGDKLGLFRALHELGPTTSANLAKHTGTHERYVREWLSAMAAGFALHRFGHARRPTGRRAELRAATFRLPEAHPGGFGWTRICVPAHGVYQARQAWEERSNGGGTPSRFIKGLARSGDQMAASPAG